MAAPRIIDDPLYQLLRQEDIAGFNARKATGEQPQLAGGDYRGLDLRGLDAAGLDFTDSYFRGADLRGIDFREAVLAGASLAEAKISGCYFPANLDAQEIQLSIQHGTRLRQRH